MSAERFKTFVILGGVDFSTSEAVPRAHPPGSGPEGLVDVSGCGATTSNPRWSGNDELKLDVTVPKKPPNTTMNLLLHSDNAVGPGAGDNQQLDGNTNPTDASGVAPIS